MIGPTPTTSVTVVDDAATALVMRALSATRSRSAPRTSARSSVASRRRSIPTWSAGRIRRSSAAARVAESWRGKPPATSRHNTVWSRQTARVRSATKSWCRFASSRNTAEWSSRTTSRSFEWRNATTAAERASSASVLSIRAVSSNRALADNVGGTSRTVSPTATSCCANNAPVPVAPSIAQHRGSNRVANATNSSR